MTDYSTKRADRATLLKLIGKIAKKKAFSVRNVPKAHRLCVQAAFFAKEKPSEIRTAFCCLDLLFFVEQCVVWIYCFLLNNALLMFVVFTEQCLVDIIAFC